jgi:hypothetical protein
MDLRRIIGVSLLRMLETRGQVLAAGHPRAGDGRNAVRRVAEPPIVRKLLRGRPDPRGQLDLGGARDDRGVHDVPPFDLTDLVEIREPDGGLAEADGLVGEDDDRDPNRSEMLKARRVW